MSWDYPWWFFSLGRFSPGGPTYYDQIVRLAADAYFERSVLAIISIATTFIIVLILILPIIHHRLNSFITAVNSIGIGVVISLCLISPEWLTGHVVIQSPIDYFSSKIYWMEMRLHVGLASTNVTLKNPSSNFAINFIKEYTNRSSFSILNETNQEIFFYNERIQMFKPELLDPDMKTAIEYGLPIPLLSIIHFLTLSTEGIHWHWSQDIMEAGYHCYCILSISLGFWFFAILFLAAIPRYSSYTFIFTGFLMIINCVVYYYWVRVETHFPSIYVSGTFIELKYGLCFWICFIVGVWGCTYGFALSVYDRIHPDKFLTIFDIDYDHKHALATAHRLNTTTIKYSPEELVYHHVDKVWF